MIHHQSIKNRFTMQLVSPEKIEMDGENKIPNGILRSIAKLFSDHDSDSPPLKGLALNPNSGAISHFLESAWYSAKKT